MAFETPILLIAFNRPQHTQKVLMRIRNVKPRQLFVAIDGPRLNHETDLKLVEEVKHIVSSTIDWDCELIKNYRNENLGCGKAPAEAISWFFSKVEEGIILEDDCLPTLSFFSFCQLMLSEYRTNSKVMAISGYTFFGEWHPDRYDYFFSDGGNWGWASWNRAWKLFDYKMSSWTTLNESERKRIEQFYPSFDLLYKKIVVDHYDAWDIQWHYARLLHDGLCVTPSQNMVQNFGFGKLATHTFDTESELANYPTYEMNLSKPLRSPTYLGLDLEYREAIIKAFFEQRPMQNSLARNIYIRLRSIVNRVMR